MDSRSAAHVLNQIGALLDLTGAPRFNSRAYQKAASSILALGADDIALLLESGELRKTPGVGPATISVIRELVETGESSYLERLTERTPRGLIQMARVPGLGVAKVSVIHSELGVESLDELEEAARDGRLAKLKGFGPKTAERILAGIAFARDSGRRSLYHRALQHAVILRESVLRHPDVAEAFIAGAVRRHREIVGDIDIVVICNADPVEVARSFADAPAVKEAVEDGPNVAIQYIDETRMDLWCATPEDAAVTLWRATASEEHIVELTAYAAARGMAIEGGRLLNKKGRALKLAAEHDFFAAQGLEEIPLDLREGMGEIEAAADHALPDLLVSEDIQGVLHCHSTWSDGVGTIEEMAEAAIDRGWTYIGITDHSQAAFYAGGLKRDKILRQHEEIDELNAGMERFRILKGIECDILADGRLDYDDDTLSLFDFVVGSVHSRFKMDQAAMTARILSAMDDPRLTILGHPTGRLLLSRDGYALDLDAVIEKAAETGTALELNCDPHRMDLDWRHCRVAKERGAMIEIGPDAHSEGGLDNVEMGVGMGRKAWLTRDDVLNAQPVEDVLRIASAKGRQSVR